MTARMPTRRGGSAMADTVMGLGDSLADIRPFTVAS